MGEEIQYSRFNKSDYDHFEQRLREETELLGEWFNHQKLSSKDLIAGYELEAWLTNHADLPCSHNERFLQLADNALLSPELAKFNIEINVEPQALHSSVLSDFASSLQNTWHQCEKIASELKCNMLGIGILPTLKDEHLTLDNMSTLERYRALNEQVLRMRKGKAIKLDIVGHEHLVSEHMDVMLEAASTSLQIHIQVPQEKAVRYYNASLAVSAPMVAVGANSPFLFGHRLWEETRIPVFEQSVAAGGFAGAAEGPLHRVSFGTGYARQSLFECFQENLQHFPVLLPVQYENSVEELRYLRLHNGTIWRWNRPLIGFNADGSPHIRIEHRIVASAPSHIDNVANIAFYYGLVHYYATIADPVENILDFSQIRDNFYSAARHGIKTHIKWFDKKNISIQKLVLDVLLIEAETGLYKLGIDAEDIKLYLGVIEQRINSGQTGSAWQQQYIDLHQHDMQAMTRCYYNNQKNQPARPQLGFRELALMLNETNKIPDGLLDAKAEDLLSLLGAPTLIHLEGEIKKPLFISTLLHGNETTGFYAVQALLKHYQSQPLPRSLSIFIGNVEAAAQSVRRLDHQVDYNRIWPGTHHSDNAETDMMKTVTNIMRKRKPFASIDVHNNTGYNPHYACVNILNSHCLQLAGMFTNTVVYFTSPKGVQSSSFSDFCPALVLECGQSGEADGESHALNYLNAVLELESLPSDQPEHINLYHTVCRVIIPRVFSFGSEQDVDIMLSAAMESQNFRQLNKGTVFASINTETKANLLALNESEEDVSDDFFEIQDKQIILLKNVMLSMYTTNQRAVRQDCLCYLMERISFS